MHFLERGRARALLDSIVRGEVVDDVPKRLITRTLEHDMHFLADVAIRTMKKRNSTISTSNSRAPSMSSSKAQRHIFGDAPAWSAQQVPGDTSGPQMFLGPHPQTGSIKNLAPLRTSDLGGSAVSSVTNSPLSALTPTTPDTEIWAKMKVEMRWRKEIGRAHV